MVCVSVCVCLQPDLTAVIYCAFFKLNADDERLDHFCCKKGGTVKVLTQTEPFEFALGRRRRLICYMYVDACNKLVYTTEHSVWQCNTILGDVIALQLASNQLADSFAVICSRG